MRSEMNLCWFGICCLFFGCGLERYPGQPGVVTDGYSKIDMEFLDNEGLWVYEVNYDNRTGGKGVGAILTKLYPHAETFTSSVRTNSDGSLFWAKAQYDGAELQMVSTPRIKQILLPPKSKVWLLLDLESSEDEVDLRNIAEEGMFELGFHRDIKVKAVNPYKAFRWEALRAGRLTVRGSLSYEVIAVQLADKKFSLPQVVVLETSFLQNGATLQITSSLKDEIVRFIETNFPKGYHGEVKFFVKGVSDPLSLQLGLNTLKTASASGYTVIQNRINLSDLNRLW